MISHDKTSNQPTSGLEKTLCSDESVSSRIPAFSELSHAEYAKEIPDKIYAISSLLEIGIEPEEISRDLLEKSNDFVWAGHKGWTLENELISEKILSKEKAAAARVSPVKYTLCEQCREIIKEDDKMFVSPYKNKYCNASCYIHFLAD